MPVTELALLRLLHGTDISDPSFRSTLKHAKEVMEKASRDLASNISSHPSDNPTHITDNPALSAHHDYNPKVHYFTQHEDAKYLYIIGSWPSAALHLESFVPSAENQQILQSLKDKVAVESFVHIYLDEDDIPLDAPTLVIRRHVMTPWKNANFIEAFDDNKHHMEHFSKRKLVGGWQVEKGEREDGGENETFVVFSGWDDVEHHRAFGESDRGEEYAKIVEWIDEGGLEVRHAVKVDI